MRVNMKGRVFQALVLDKREGRLEVEPLQRGAPIRRPPRAR
jgi:hypothetical protein